MQQIQSLKTTNSAIYVLSIIGSLATLIFGSRTCVSDCEYSSLADYVINPSMIAFAIAGLLFSTLLFQVVNVFALHVERSNKN